MRLNEDTQFEKKLQKIFNMDLPESELVDKKLNTAYQQIYRQAKKGKVTGGKQKMKTNKFLYGKALAIVAGVMIVVLGGIGVANPALAANIPFIGKIFSYLEERVSYPGDYSENAVVVEEQEQGNDDGAIESQGNSVAKDSEYVQSQNGITVAVTEFNRDENKLYMALRITNDEGFPEDFQTKYPDSGLSILSCVTSAVVHRENQDDAQYSEGYGNIPLTYIEGEYQDDKTFVGIAMLEFDDLTKCTWIDIAFHSFYGLLASGYETEGYLDGEDEAITIYEHDQKIYEGPWNFTIVPGEGIKSQEFIVDQKNDEGFGIARVVKSAYEISAEPVLPEGTDLADYIVTIWDADGKPLESHGGNVETYATYGHNIDEITVYLMEFETWLECKGKNVDKQAENAVFTAHVSLK